MNKLLKIAIFGILVILGVSILLKYGTQPMQELEIKVLKEGSGVEAQNGDTVYVHYTGKLDDGTVFDSSVTRGTPFDFELGAGRVIKGWDLGVKGMKVGEKRELIIPSKLGYGDAGAPPTIPGKATLTFEVELLSINEEPAQ